MGKKLNPERAISPELFGGTLVDIMRRYRNANIKLADEASQKAMKSLVEKTRLTAPRSSRFVSSYYAQRKRKTEADGSTPRQHFYMTISYVRRSGYAYSKYLWYVRSPNYRLTHLLEKDHKARNGHTVSGRHFIQNALDEVLPEYEADLIDALARSIE